MLSNNLTLYCLVTKGRELQLHCGIKEKKKEERNIMLHCHGSALHTVAVSLHPPIKVGFMNTWKALFPNEKYFFMYFDLCS